MSVISIWEIAMLEANGRLNFFRSVEEWTRLALTYPGIRLLDLNPEIAIASTRLPPPFHKDPADRILVATARFWGVPILTEDSKILAYPHVTCLS